MKFHEVIGQETVKNKLTRSVNENRISHALLFVGSEGAGALPLAIAYARYIACEARSDEDACGKCVPCKQFDKLIHPDLHFVFPVATSKSVSKDPVSDDYIEQWRKFVLQNPYAGITAWYDIIDVENKQGIISKNESQSIIRKLNLKSFASEYKFMIIWMAEKMNTPAANKLLKILEEPAPKTIFLLIAENTETILPTILSRMQLIKIPKIENKKIADAISKEHALDRARAENIARLANGNYNKALAIINENEDNSYNFEMFTSLMRLCYGTKIAEIVTWVDNIAETGREKQKQFLQYSLRMIRENFMLNLKKPEYIYLTDTENDFSKKFSSFINIKNVYGITEEFNKAYSHIEANAYNKIVFLDLSLKLVKLIKV